MQNLMFGVFIFADWLALGQVLQLNRHLWPVSENELRKTYFMLKKPRRRCFVGSVYVSL